jgi:phosphoribosylamine---glycine ligase
VRVLVVGGGGREHALAWALSRSPSVERVLAAPGNAGIASVATCLPVATGDLAGVVALAERERADLVVVGPEAPLVSGLTNELRASGVAVFGPGADGARLEGSKAWARALCERNGIPAPRSRTFTEVRPALDFLDELGAPPFVVKADGLAAGKGVVIAEDRPGAERALRASLEEGAFGAAGRTVVVEEFLDGEEVSAMAFTDGRVVVPMAFAQDFKRVGDGDTGPNTGGMGAYSPLPFLDDVMSAEITSVLERTVRALREEGIEYRGVVYAGLMLTADGAKVLEFNCRFGDPETQVVLPRLDGDLGEICRACATGDLTGVRVRWREEACVGVVAASDGYPGSYETGFPIEGLSEASSMDGVEVFHSGTAERDGRVVTAGGRVLTVSAMGPTVEEARDRAYQAFSLIRFDGMVYRTDVAGRVRSRA